MITPHSPRTPEYAVTISACPEPRLRERGQVAVVSLPAEIDLVNAAEVQASLIAAIRTGVPLVIADMSATTFCGADGVTAVERAAKAAAEAGTVLRVTGAGRLTRRAFALLGQGSLLGA
jgi:anti-anti-sigma regulatory factor